MEQQRQWGLIAESGELGDNLQEVTESDLIRSVAALSDEDVRQVADQLGIRVTAVGRRKAVVSLLTVSMRIASEALREA